MADNTPGTSEYYPMKLYIYRMDGYHDGGEYIKNEEQLKAMLHGPVAVAIPSGVEVVITDCWDNCVFEAKGGWITWPPST